MRSLLLLAPLLFAACTRPAPADVAIDLRPDAPVQIGFGPTPSSSSTIPIDLRDKPAPSVITIDLRHNAAATARAQPSELDVETPAAAALEEPQAGNEPPAASGEEALIEAPVEAGGSDGNLMWVAPSAREHGDELRER